VYIYLGSRLGSEEVKSQDAGRSTNFLKLI